ncbi:hypothetical protein ACQ4LE_000937 [Meloidogyne hapla]|uniref:MFS domain-containing protein n=1 Tax=Meloidogyne hapla TaxID=6305 RepID=A0A1I8B7C8_MELHA
MVLRKRAFSHECSGKTNSIVAATNWFFTFVIQLSGECPSILFIGATFVLFIWKYLPETSGKKTNDVYVEMELRMKMKKDKGIKKKEENEELEMIVVERGKDEEDVKKEKKDEDANKEKKYEDVKKEKKAEGKMKNEQKDENEKIDFDESSTFED